MASHEGIAIGQFVIQRPDSAAVPVSLPPRLPMLVGREGLLSVLDARWQVSEGPWPRLAVLVGMGGAGKTTLAVEYAHRHLTEFGLAWKLSAESQTTLGGEFARLAAQLGVREVLDARDPVASAHAALAAFPRPWLLIFDNAPDSASVRSFLPPGGRGRVLITTQSQQWPAGQAVEVPPLDDATAARFLVDRTGDADIESARELTAELGGLPLALEQIAAYILATGSTLSSYLTLYRVRRAELLTRGEPTGYDKTVATTWLLAFNRLEQDAPQAAGLLKLLAFFASEPIPLGLVLPRPGIAAQVSPAALPELVPLLEDAIAAADAVAALGRYSLLRSAGDGRVLVHRLVQEVTSNRMPSGMAAQWRQAAVILIEAAIPSDTRRSDNWPACSALLPHAQAAIDDYRFGMARIADYLAASGGYAAARDIQAKVADAYERLHGSDDPETLAARHFLAFLTGEAGDAGTARDQYAELLAAHERAFNGQHPDSLAVRANFALWTGRAGDPAAARDQFAELLPVHERALGAEHSHTLAVRANLAIWTGEAGGSAVARDHLAALLPVCERVLGAEHPDTLDVRDNIARWTGASGDPLAARNQYIELLRTVEQVYGPEHPRTLAIRASSAMLTGESGDVAGARTQYAALLPVIDRILGPEHPETLNIHHEHARWAGQCGDAVAARDQLADLMPIRKRVLGPEHPDTLATRHELARWTGEAGDAAAARDQFAALLPIREKVSGPEHPDTLVSRGNFAGWTGEAGDPTAAREEFRALVPIAERVFGAGHPHTLTTRANLAGWTGKAGNPAAARDQYAALLPVQLVAIGPEHPLTLTTRSTLARWTGEAGDPAAARDQYAALLPVVQQVFGPDHPTTHRIQADLARWTGWSACQKDD